MNPNIAALRSVSPQHKAIMAERPTEQQKKVAEILQQWTRDEAGPPDVVYRKYSNCEPLRAEDLWARV